MRFLREELRGWASRSFDTGGKPALLRGDSLLCRKTCPAQWLGMPNHCSWSAHCAASLSLPSRSPSSPLPSMSSPSSSTVASVGLSSFSIFCIPSKDFWSLGSRLQGGRHTLAFIKMDRFFWDDAGSERSPERYAVLIHGFLEIADGHQEISQHPVQDTVALIGQGAAEELDPLFVLLFPTLVRTRAAQRAPGHGKPAAGVRRLHTEQLGHLDHGFGVVGSLGQSSVQQGFSLLLRHGVLQTHRGEDGQRLRVGSQSFIDVVGHSHSFPDPVGRQVTVNQTCQATAAKRNSLVETGPGGLDPECRTHLRSSRADRAPGAWPLGNGWWPLARDSCFSGLHPSGAKPARCCCWAGWPWLPGTRPWSSACCKSCDSWDNRRKVKSLPGARRPETPLLPAVAQTHPVMTQGSACWSDILNNRPPRTSTSSRCPSRAIKYP